MSYKIWYLIFINMITFAAFGIDKYRAQRHAYRIPERTLFLLAIAGGSLGAEIGMHCFHHKTRHARFAAGIPVILLFQLILLLYWPVMQ